MDIVNVAILVVVDAIPSNLLGVFPKYILKIFMSKVDTRVNYGYQYGLPFSLFDEFCISTIYTHPWYSILERIQMCPTQCFLFSQRPSSRNGTQGSRICFLRHRSATNSD